MPVPVILKAGARMSKSSDWIIPLLMAALTCSAEKSVLLTGSVVFSVALLKSAFARLSWYPILMPLIAPSVKSEINWPFKLLVN